MSPFKFRPLERWQFQKGREGCPGRTELEAPADPGHGWLCTELGVNTWPCSEKGESTHCALGHGPLTR